MKDHVELVYDWLKECAASSKSDGHALLGLIRSARNDPTLIRGLFDLFSEDSEATINFAEQLAELYRTNDNEARLFTLEFLPAVMLAYINSVYLQTATAHSALSSCILSLFNTTVALSNNAENEFRMPNLTRSSYYHEIEASPSTQPSSTLPRALTSTSPIAALAAGLLSTVATGPIGIDAVQNTNSQQQQRSSTEQNFYVNAFGAATSPALRISAELRYPILCRLLVNYNRHVSLVSAASLSAACRLCEKLCALDCSVSNSNGDAPSSTSAPNTNILSTSVGLAPRRIPVDHFFVTQLVLSVCHALWNGLYREADHALNVAEQRATHELFCDVLLLINAVRNGQKTMVSGTSLEQVAPPGGRQFTIVSNVPARPKSVANVSQRAKSESPNVALGISAAGSRQPTTPFGASDNELDRPRTARSTTDVHIDVPLSAARPIRSRDPVADAADETDDGGLNMRALRADTDDQEASESQSQSNAASTHF